VSPREGGEGMGGRGGWCRGGIGKGRVEGEGWEGKAGHILSVESNQNVESK